VTGERLRRHAQSNRAKRRSVEQSCPTPELSAIRTEAEQRGRPRGLSPGCAYSARSNGCAVETVSKPRARTTLRTCSSRAPRRT